MKEEYFKIPFGTIYLKVVAGTIYSLQRELVKEGKDWIIIEKLEEVKPIEKDAI
jgi:hypothetical protein